MERFSPKNGASRASQTPQQRPATQAGGQETFSQMASVTAEKSGVVGKLLVISLIIVSIAVTAFVGYAIFAGLNGTDENNDLIAEDKYQAVFLTDGQIYFGKLSNIGEDYVELTDIYYLQVQQQVQPVQEGEEQPQAQQQISLAKLGNELHGPEDKMFINEDRILFWENLKTDGDVTCAIERYVNGSVPAECEVPAEEQQQQPVQ